VKRSEKFEAKRSEKFEAKRSESGKKFEANRAHPTFIRNWINLASSWKKKNKRVPVIGSVLFLRIKLC
jgi:hypothetical protein